MTLYDLVNTLDTSTSVTLYTRTQVGARALVMHSDPLNVNELKRICHVSNKLPDVNIYSLKAEGDNLYVRVNFINE